MAKKVAKSFSRSDFVSTTEEINKVLNLSNEDRIIVGDVDKVSNIITKIKEISDELFVTDPWSKGTKEIFDHIGIVLQDPPEDDDKDIKEEEAEAEELEGDELDDMDRKALKSLIAKDKLDIRITTKMSDNDLRQAIREAHGGTTEEEEEPEEEPEVEEELEAEEPEEESDGLLVLDRSALKKVIADEKLDIKVMKSWSDDEIRNKILEARPQKKGVKKGKGKNPNPFQKKAYNRLGVMAGVIRDMKKGSSMTIEEIIQTANDNYVKLGGEANVKESKRTFMRVQKILTPMELINSKDGKVIKL